MGSRYMLPLKQVVAEANTDSQPLPGFTPRRGAGLALFGKSSTDPPIRKVRTLLQQRQHVWSIMLAHNPGRLGTLSSLTPLDEVELLMQMFGVECI